MAKAINQSIPPSLRAGVAQVLSIPGNTAGAGAVIGLRPSARSSQTIPLPPATLRLVRQAAYWFHNYWPAPKRDEPYDEFQMNRRMELTRMEFPAKYWYELTPLEDVTDYGEPTVDVYAGDLNKPWFDETRLPTLCEYERALRTYPTPSGPGTESNPAPGWKGAVISGYWRDLWFAQRRLTYALPQLAYRPINAGTGRPIVALIEGNVRAEASFRGYESWFALCTYPYLYHATNSPPPEPDRLITGWHKDHLARFILPPALVSDWSGQANWKTIRPAYYRPHFGDRPICNRLMLRITSPPSRGIYFARNDAVSVTHTATIRVFQAKAWNG